MTQMNLSADYLNRAELWLGITILVYFLMNGAQVFETLVFVPKWTAYPPENFGLLKDGNGTSLKSFWIIFHSLHEITFIVAIVLCWKIAWLRNWLLILFTMHFAVRVWTIAYFAPNIIDFQKIADNPSLGTGLLKKTNLWKKFNYLRVALFIAISIGLVPLYSKLQNLRNLN